MNGIVHDLSSVLLRGTVEATVVLGLALLLCRALRSVSPEVRGGVAWLGALKVLVACAGLAPLALPLLPRGLPQAPAHPVAFAPEQVQDGPARSGVVTIRRPPPSPGEGAPQSRSFRSALREELPAVLLALWATGALFAGARLIRRMWCTHSLVANAVPSENPALEALLASLKERAGLSRNLALRLSVEAPAPFVAGAIRPTIVLPVASLERLSEDALKMALAHEIAHVRRRDLWLGWIPALADVVLWFHPLARAANREYLQAREEACDAEALRLTSAEPADYGELLLALGVVRGSDASTRAQGASPALRHLHRRLQMLQLVHLPRSRAQRCGGALALAACVALLPLGIGQARPAPAQLAMNATAAVIWPEGALPPPSESRTPNGRPARGKAAPARADARPLSGELAHPGAAPPADAPEKPRPARPPAAPAPAAEPAPPAAAEPARPAQPDSANEGDDADTDDERPQERAKRDAPMPAALGADLAKRIVEAIRAALPEDISRELRNQGIHLDQKLARELSRFERKWRALERSRSALEVQRDALEKSEQELASQQSEEEARRAALEEKLSELEEDENAHPDQLREVERSVRALERSIAALERSRNELERERDRYEQQMEQLEEQRESLEESLEDALESLSDAEGDSDS